MDSEILSQRIVRLVIGLFLFAYASIGFLTESVAVPAVFRFGSQINDNYLLAAVALLVLAAFFILSAFKRLNAFGWLMPLASLVLMAAAIVLE